MKMGWTMWMIIAGGGALLSGMSLGGAVSAETQPASKSSTFRVYEAMLYAGKPDLSREGVARLKIVYTQELWPEGVTGDLPDEDVVGSVARKAREKSDVIVLDVEHWSLDAQKTNVAVNVSKYQQLVRRFKAEIPDSTVGYYGVPPIRDYWRAISDRDSGKYAEWMTSNNTTIPIAASVDAFFPSLYTFYANESEWVRYAEAQIREARRLRANIPIYVFLWPQYHQSNLNLDGRFIGPAFWRRQLMTAYEHADGIVIWGGWDTKRKGRMKWDEQADWWIETKRFMREIRQADTK